MKLAPGIAARPALRAPSRPPASRRRPRAPTATPRPPDAPAPSSTAPGQAWAEHVGDDRQWRALERALVSLVAEGESSISRPVTSFLETPARATSALVVARSFGCPFCQQLARELAADALPTLDAAGVPLFLVSIGTPATGAQFAALTGFPESRLLADPGNQAYDALGLERGVGAAFLSPTTPLAIGRRLATADGRETLGAALRAWVPYQPPGGVGQSKFQGGCWVFLAQTTAYARVDRATADHVDPGELVERALEVAKEAGL